MAVVVEDTLLVTWAALVVLAWRAAESAADMGMAAGSLVAAEVMPVRLCSWRPAIAATDTNLTVYPPPL
jgi:hypothetical protein